MIKLVRHLVPPIFVINPSYPYDCKCYLKSNKYVSILLDYYRGDCKTLAENFLILLSSFIPPVSIPLETSTPHGAT